MSRLRDLLDRTPRQTWQSLWRRLRGEERVEPDPARARCLFVLSTGRAGTQTLAALLDLAPGLLVRHEPRPLLFGLGRLAYQHPKDRAVHDALREAFVATREDLLGQAQCSDLVYVETSPQATFLAPRIAELLPLVRFIHLTRDPRAVVRSGMRRQWYAGHAGDRTRIQPPAGSAAAKAWESMSPFEKNVWLWNETNVWIRDFLKTIPAPKRAVLRSEDLFEANEDALRTLYATVDVAAPAADRVQAVLSRRLNAQETGDFPEPESWTEIQKETLRECAGQTASDLGYDLG